VVSARQAGFTYLTALFVVAILGTGLALAGEVWETSVKREREAELLFAGHQYRAAIARYFLSGPQRQYPRSLEELLEDPRRPGTERYLRKLYPDPITGEAFGLVKAPDGGIVGVHSTSEAAPLKTAGFRPRDAALEGAKKYSDWKFVHAAPMEAVTQPAAQPGAPPVPPNSAEPVQGSATPNPATAH
jgi:type II secretory pathway pseudopilin PulG